MTIEKIVLVKKNTELEELLLRHATTSQVKFFLESRGQSYDRILNSHESYKSGVRKVCQSIPSSLRQQTVDKEDLSTFQFGDKDLVVAIGDPGIMVNVAKYIGSQYVIAVKPEESRYDNIFASCNQDSFPIVLKNTLENKIQIEKLTMAKATLVDDQVMYALNDLFIGKKTHVSAKYKIEHEGREENQSSSGIIVSTGTGSTGWLTSVVTGATALCGQKVDLEVPYSRQSNHLYFVVREPFPSKCSQASLVYGTVTKEEPLKIVSYMPENGVIFSDGVESDYIEFNAGQSVTIIPAKKKIHLVRTEE